jgi:hypothetical protein
MKMSIFRIKQLTAAAIIAVAVPLAFAGARPALAGVATGEAAFENGDFLTAAREFQGPAHRGDPLAQYYLAVIYADGLGGAQSHEDALAWLMCVEKGVGLPPAMKQDAVRRRAGILSAITPYALEQAEMRAAALCDKATAHQPEAFTTDHDQYQDVRPMRGWFGTVFFFPGDTIILGAIDFFHEMEFILLRNVLAGMVKLLRDLLFGLLSLISWVLMGRIVYYLFIGPLWKALAATKPPSADDSVGGPAQSQSQESVSD